MKRLFFTLSVLLASFNSFAHPHIWVATDLALLTKNSAITGLTVHWQFDEMYSTAYMLDADINGDKKLDAAEQKIMQKQVMNQAISRLRPFVLLQLNGKEITDFSFNNLKITYDESTEKINYNFEIDLKTPQPLKGNHKLAILDKEYYVGFEQSYDFKIPQNCSFELEEDQDILVYDGLINPETYKLVCK